jgi:hypothetical protein
METLVRSTAAAFVLLVVAASAGAQQSPTREESLRKLENTFKVTTFFTADSPLLIDLLHSAKSANPGVSESTWQSLRAEFATSVNTSMQNDSGATLRWLNVALSQLSDSEVERIAQIYSDPVFVKAQQSMASAASQQEAMRRTFLNSQLMMLGINSVLKKHGMREVH